MKLSLSLILSVSALVGSMHEAAADAGGLQKKISRRRVKERATRQLQGRRQGKGKGKKSNVCSTDVALTSGAGGCPLFEACSLEGLTGVTCSSADPTTCGYEDIEILSDTIFAYAEIDEPDFTFSEFGGSSGFVISSYSLSADEVMACGNLIEDACNAYAAPIETRTCEGGGGPIFDPCVAFSFCCDRRELESVSTDDEHETHNFHSTNNRMSFNAGDDKWMCKKDPF